MKKRYFLAAKAVALTSKGKYRLGTVVVKHGRIIAARCNSYSKTHSALAKFTEFPFQHAETAALIAAGSASSRGCEVYVCRLDRQGNICMARPCKEVCEPYMREAGVSTAYYTIDNCSYGTMELT